MKTVDQILLGVFSATIASAALLCSSPAQATPAFARQMNMNCMGCHNQNVPLLNSFGRQFKQAAFTMTAGDQPTIAGTSLPRAFNGGLGVRGAQLDSTAPSKPDTLAFPSGASLLLGGKVVEDLGANLLFSGDGVVHMQASVSRPVGGWRAGGSLFGTNTHGPFIAVDSYNTGLHKEIAMFDNATRTNAAQATGLGAGPATGLSAFVAGRGLTVGGGVWALAFNSVLQDGKAPPWEGGLNSFYRLAWDAPSFGGWSATVGAFGANGSTRGRTSDLYEVTQPAFTTAPWFNAAKLYDHEIASNGFDIQLQGSVSGMNLLAVLNHIPDYEFSLTDAVTRAKRTVKNQRATSLEVQLMPWDRLGFRAGWLDVSDKANSANDYSALSFGINFNYAPNVRFSVEHSAIDNDKAQDFREVLLTAFFAF